MKIGRPFKGNVQDDSSIEPNVPEKRSVFRRVKKHYSKGSLLKLKSIEKDADFKTLTKLQQT